MWVGFDSMTPTERNKKDAAEIYFNKKLTENGNDCLKNDISKCFCKINHLFPHNVCGMKIYFIGCKGANIKDLPGDYEDMTWRVEGI
jgi:hypothetical protein